MAVLSLLADPMGYRPCTTNDMHVDIPFREHWVRHFMHHFKMVMRLAVETYGPEAQPRADACYADLIGRFQSILDNPRQYERLDLLVLDALRQDILLAHNLPDPFEGTKTRENEAALPLYPAIVAELDSHTSPEEALLLAVEGVFTGNIFDLGAHASVDMFANESPDFLSIRDKFGGKRPWLIDHFDAWYRRLADVPPASAAGVHASLPRYRQAMLFCDNAGPDFLLGVLPFCRLLAKAGTRVIIAANRLPALNDITVGEIRALLPRLQALDPTLDDLVRTGQILPIDSGNAIPLIDLREISEEVNRHAPQTDLLILEGMGRAVETNLEAEFTCDSLKLAMIKDQLVADRQGGKLFDTVCKFDVASASRR
jgi:damage-control phosphatase, subfamily II, stand-alone protein